MQLFPLPTSSDFAGYDVNARCDVRAFGNTGRGVQLKFGRAVIVSLESLLTLESFHNTT